MDWYSVRCILRMVGTDGLFEERVTLWRSDSFDRAIEQAEAEARDYAQVLGMRYLGLAQAFKLADAPGDGGEVFSLMRESDLDDEDYLTWFFDTGTERQTTA